MNDTPDMVYLCTIDDLAGQGADDDLALRRMQLLGSMLVKLGWVLGSGTDGQYHELWAMPPERPESRDWAAIDVERRLLAWLHITFGVLPAPDEAGGWAIEYNGGPVRLRVEASSEHRWLLRLDEADPAPFSEITAHHFRRGGRIRSTLEGGTIRTELRAADLRIDFDDQAERTGG